MKVIKVSKDECDHSLIPTVWRETFVKIVNSFVEKDYQLIREVNHVVPLSVDEASEIEANICDYGEALICLPSDAWNTSVCQWMCGYWEVIIDLYTEGEGASDLILSAKVYEKDDFYLFEVQSVHVP